MPMGTPPTVWASVTRFMRRTGWTKLSTTMFTDGWPLPRSMIQWFFWSNSVMSRTLAHVQKSLPQCQVP